MNTHSNDIAAAANLLRQALNIVAFTGAGVSTASGIPDFRSPTSGLWDNADPMAIASLSSFRQDPMPFFNWVRPLLATLIQAQPNETHKILAQLEKNHHLKAIITQNIDGLHQQAGNTRVHEIHGHFRTATCAHCFKQYDALPLVETFQKSGKIPYCDCQKRGSVIKPDVILFGEQLPIQVVNAANSDAMKSDLMLVLGSSLRVAPANHIPLQAVEYGSRLIIINYEPTPLDRHAEIVINGDVNTILPQIVDLLDRIV